MALTLATSDRSNIFLFVFKYQLAYIMIIHQLIFVLIIMYIKFICFEGCVTQTTVIVRWRERVCAECQCVSYSQHTKQGCVCSLTYFTAVDIAL